MKEAKGLKTYPHVLLNPTRGGMENFAPSALFYIRCSALWLYSCSRSSFPPYREEFRLIAAPDTAADSSPKGSTQRGWGGNSELPRGRGSPEVRRMSTARIRGLEGRVCGASDVAGVSAGAGAGKGGGCGPGYAGR